VVGLLTAAVQRLAVVLAAAGLVAATAAGLIITIEVGMFCFRETWSAPYVRTSLHAEIVGTVVLLNAAWRVASIPGSGLTPLVSCGRAGHRWVNRQGRRRRAQPSGERYLAASAGRVQPWP
jgi:hypothetical protein